MSYPKDEINYQKMKNELEDCELEGYIKYIKEIEIESEIKEYKECEKCSMPYFE